MSDDDDPDARLNAVLRRLDADGERALAGVAGLQQQLATLIDILTHAGTLRPGHAQLIERVRRNVVVARTPAIELGPEVDKFTVEPDDAPIDCEARLHLCHARCCSFTVRLSRQDLEEGELRWDIDHPYRLPRDGDGQCTYLGRTDGRCGAYAHRPATCRSYSCRDDRRVWLDFDGRVPAPMPDTLVPLRLRGGEDRG
jgi:hypothetical protein